MESFKFRIPEFESQSFFFLFSLSFCSSRKLEFLMFYVKAFFTIWRVLNSFANESKANTMLMQCRCRRSITFVNRRRKLGKQYHWTRQRKGLTEARVSLSGWWSETRQKRRNLKGLERKRVQLLDFEVRWACFVSRACILVKEDRDKGTTWASGDRSCVGNRLQLRCWHCQHNGGHVKLNESES